MGGLRRSRVSPASRSRRPPQAVQYAKPALELVPTRVNWGGDTTPLARAFGLGMPFAELLLQVVAHRSNGARHRRHRRLCLLARHRLRAGDAVQLASCLYLQREMSQLLPFVAFDDRPAEARHEGLTVVPASRVSAMPEAPLNRERPAASLPSKVRPPKRPPPARRREIC
jgi:hypothetical protein